MAIKEANLVHYGNYKLKAKEYPQHVFLCEPDALDAWIDKYSDYYNVQRDEIEVFEIVSCGKTF
jgi:hypothetical protein